jgi:hypothetical protein
MQLPPIVEALRNIKNGKLFICLEACDSPGNVRVVNPNGDVLVVREELFELEPIEIAEDQVLTTFTAEQLATLQRWLIEQAEEAERRRLEPPAPSEPERPARRLVSSASKPRLPAQRREPKNVMITKARGRIAAQWDCDRLTFYRHRIDPLQLTEQFVVKVEGEGEYQMTKAEFQRVFNNVIMSPSYRANGLFSYQTTPPEAQPFLKRK